MPSEPTLFVESIRAAWSELDDANVANKRWNLEQLKAQKMCAIKAELFRQKAATHMAWTDGKIELMQQDDFSHANLGTVGALIKKLEAFESDRLARETAVHEIGTLAAELDDAAYGDAAEINNT